MSRGESGRAPTAGAPAAAVRRLGVGTGPDGRVSAEVALDLGPHHPVSPGSLRLRLTLDGERILAAEPVVGLLHRGTEKLFEVRDYRQVVSLAGRNDGLSSFAGELGACLVVEEALGLQPPPRAVALRMLLAELTRVSAHLAFLTAFPPGGLEPPSPGPGLRERVVALVDELAGSRVHPLMAQPGGFRTDVPPGWPEQARHIVAVVRSRLTGLHEALVAPGVRQRTRNVGVLAADLVLAYGASGTMARASGVDVDVRRDEPYLDYAELFAPGGPGRVPTRKEGDAAARLEVLAEQAGVALDLADACLDRLEQLTDGPVHVRLPRVLRVPEGEWYRATETPVGMAGFYLVSRGEQVPWRLKVRSASFANVAVLADLLPGCLLPDLATVVASCGVTVGDVDR